MPFTKEQLKVYWQANKEILNQNRRQKRRLAKLGLAIQVSQKETEVSHLEVSHHIEMANPKKVSHSQPKEMANLKVDNHLTKLIHQYQTNTNYSCAPGCQESKYCSNCWYFFANKLVDYKKEIGM